MEILYIFRKKMKFLNSVTQPKNVEWAPFGIFQHQFCCKLTKLLKEGPFGAIQKLSKKSHSTKKFWVKNTKGAKEESLVGFRGYGRRFLFLFVLDEVLRFERFEHS